MMNRVPSKICFTIPFTRNSSQAIYKNYTVHRPATAICIRRSPVPHYRCQQVRCYYLMLSRSSFVYRHELIKEANGAKGQSSPCGVKQQYNLLQASLFSNCSTSEHACWSCGAAQHYSANNVDGIFFCSTCKKVLPVHMDSNYFTTMNCPEDFEVDSAKLTNHYKQLQAILHPDKYAQASAMVGKGSKWYKELGTYACIDYPKVEQEYSAAQSSLVNKAYRTLLDPLARAIYMLELYGCTIEETNTSADPDFLAEMFEINEALMECNNIRDLNDIEEANEGRITIAIGQVSDALRKGDFALAKEMVVKLKYYYNIRETIKDKRLSL